MLLRSGQRNAVKRRTQVSGQYRRKLTRDLKSQSDGRRTPFLVYGGHQTAHP